MGQHLGQDCQPNLTAVVAMTPAGVIGRQGGMPWKLSSDLRRFKKLTMGGVLVMGRKTYESIGRPLPGRDTIVITGNPDWAAAGVSVVTSPEAAIELAADRPTFVVGGATIYRQLVPRCGTLLLTQVLADVAGDTVVDLDLAEFQVIERVEVPPSERDQYPSVFMRMERRSQSG